MPLAQCPIYLACCRSSPRCRAPLGSCPEPRHARACQALPPPRHMPALSQHSAGRTRRQLHTKSSTIPCCHLRQPHPCHPPLRHQATRPDRSQGTGPAAHHLGLIQTWERVSDRNASLGPLTRGTIPKIGLRALLCHGPARWPGNHLVVAARTPGQSPSRVFCSPTSISHHR